MEKQAGAPKRDDEESGSRGRTGSAVRDFLHYLITDGKWWLTLIIAAWVVVVGVLVLGGTSAAPVVYKLF